MTSFWKKSLIIAPSLILLGFASQAHAASQDYSVKISEHLTYPDNYLSRTTAEQNHQTTFVIPQNVLQSLNEQKNSPTPRPVFFNHTSGSLAQYVEDLTSPRENKSLSSELVTFIEKNIKPNLTESQPQNAIWREEKGRVVEFNSGSIGKSFDTLDLAYAIIAGVKLGQNEIVFNPVLVNPQTNLSSLNSYGIESLVARGVSNFSGSSRNRITNIRTGSSRYNGLIIPAGETFSFNDQLGPIDGKHGFAPEIVIKGKDLIPEFGGGLCQVSTTFFRAALNAGFPVVERHNHAFAVAYYSPSGTDATIYTGVIDLRVKNDTGSPVMIWTHIEGTNLVFDLYGKPDGRTVTVEKPTRYDVTSYGTFKTALSRKITFANGETRQDTLRSTYRPAAEFSRTDTAKEPVPPVPAPTTPPVETPESPEEPTTTTP